MQILESPFPPFFVYLSPGVVAAAAALFWSILSPFQRCECWPSFGRIGFLICAYICLCRETVFASVSKQGGIEARASGYTQKGEEWHWSRKRRRRRQRRPFQPLLLLLSLSPIHSTGIASSSWINTYTHIMLEERRRRKRRTGRGPILACQWKTDRKTRTGIVRNLFCFCSLLFPPRDGKDGGKKRYNKLPFYYFHWSGTIWDKEAQTYRQ